MKLGDCLGPAQLEFWYLSGALSALEAYQCVSPGIILASMSFWISTHGSPSSGGPEGSTLRK